MTKRRAVAVGVLTALAAVATAAVLAWSGSTADAEPAAPTGPEKAASGATPTKAPHEIASYWTDERMKNAEGG